MRAWVEPPGVGAWWLYYVDTTSHLCRVDWPPVGETWANYRQGGVVSGTTVLGVLHAGVQVVVTDAQNAWAIAADDLTTVLAGPWNSGVQFDYWGGAGAGGLVGYWTTTAPPGLQDNIWTPWWTPDLTVPAVAAADPQNRAPDYNQAWPWLTANAQHAWADARTWLLLRTDARTFGSDEAWNTASYHYYQYQASGETPIPLEVGTAWVEVDEGPATYAAVGRTAAGRWVYYLQVGLDDYAVGTVRVSRDQGTTWQVTDLEQVAVISPDGSQAWGRVRELSTAVADHRISTDSGTTWTPLEAFPPGFGDPYADYPLDRAAIAIVPQEGA